MSTSGFLTRLANVTDLGIAAARRTFKRARRAHGLVLGYHRVSEVPRWDPWRLCVDPDRFDQQLAALSRVATFVPLSELTPRLDKGRGGRPLVAITFDDGYADNFYEALPLLEKYNAPATVFVSTACIDRDEPFWWDRLAAILQSAGRLPSDIKLHLDGKNFVWRRQQNRSNRDRDKTDLLLALHSMLMIATDDERCAALDQLESLLSPADDGFATGRAMTRDELRRLAASPLIEIGAHTMTHCRLPDMSPNAQFDEILGSRRQCEELVGVAPSSFAYPFGAVSRTTAELARSAGFERACSTEADLLWADSDTMLVPRVLPRNHTSRRFATLMGIQRLL